MLYLSNRNETRPHFKVQFKVVVIGPSSIFKWPFRSLQILLLFEFGHVTTKKVERWWNCMHHTHTYTRSWTFTLNTCSLPSAHFLCSVNCKFAYTGLWNLVLFPLYSHAFCKSTVGMYWKVYIHQLRLKLRQEAVIAHTSYFLIEFISYFCLVVRESVNGSIDN